MNINSTYHRGRNYHALDRLLIRASDMLAACAPAQATATRPYPAHGDDAQLNAHARRRSGRLMRVNHVGEICAQALYHSQAATARSPAVRERMRRSAAEENDHLIWCARRMDELDARASMLNPLWRLGAFAAGAAAGVAGDKWNLGFVAETERQVVAHLARHQLQLPARDTRSRAIIAQMQTDESNHADAAVAAGAAELPRAVKILMKSAARVMTSTAYWL